MIEFFVSGNPAPQGSKRAIPAKNKAGRYTGKVSMLESSKYLEAWREIVTWHAMRKRKGRTLNSALALSVVFYLEKPANTKYPDYPLGPPDTDKLLRAIGDALTQSKLIRDDALFVDTHASKRWATGKPGALIKIEALDGDLSASNQSER